MVPDALIERSASWQTERQRIRDEANRARAEAAEARRGEGGRLQAAPVDPLIEGQQETIPAPKRDAAKMHAKAAATAKAKTLGVTRARV